MPGHTVPPAGAIVTRGLRKSYGKQTVLDGIDLTVPEGTIYALLGPNGAGKTTTVRVLTTSIAAHAGDLWVAGHSVSTDPDGVRAAIAVTGQFSAVDKLLTGKENLLLIGDLLHLPRGLAHRRVIELLDRFELTDAADRYAMTYSGGMTRRLDLAMGLMGEPRVVFLDEPTTGLDPRSRQTMWQIVRELAAAGTTILLTTQQLEEADQLADRVAVLDQGRIIAEGTPAQLKGLVPGGHVSLRFDDAARLDAAADLLDGSRPDQDALTLRVPSDGSYASLRTLIDRLDRLQIAPVDFTIHRPELDDVFFALTGNPPLDSDLGVPNQEVRAS